MLQDFTSARLDVRHAGGAALLGDALAEGLRRGQEDGAFVTGTRHYRAVPSPPVPVDGVGRKCPLYEARHPVELRVRERGGDVDLREVHVLLGGELLREVPGPQAQPRRVPEHVHGTLQSRRPCLLVTLAKLRLGEFAQRPGKISVLPATWQSLTLEEEHLERRG